MRLGECTVIPFGVLIYVSMLSSTSPFVNCFAAKSIPTNYLQAFCVFMGNAIRMPTAALPGGTTDKEPTMKPAHRLSHCNTRFASPRAIRFGTQSDVLCRTDCGTLCGTHYRPQRTSQRKSLRHLLCHRLLPALLLSLAGTTALAQPTLSGHPDELREFLMPRPNLVNISGEGELTSFKDVAKVSLLVTTEARTLNESMAINQRLRQQLIGEFVAAGIPETAINNSKFSSSPQFGLFGRNPNRFEVAARLDVKVSSETHLQLLAAAADNHSEVKFERTEFEHSLEDDFEDQVRELALQDVMEQKAYYEASLGLQLHAVNFYYGGIRKMPRVMPLAAAPEMAMDATATRGAVMSSEAAPAVAPSFDEVEYQTSVTVVFEIVNNE